HPCSFYRGTITSSGFPLKACGNDSVVELSALCPLTSVLCPLSSGFPLKACGNDSGVELSVFWIPAKSMRE
ncbi:MAG TPA: hypothetical protein PK661_10385, partial [Syntrophorhabdaceae bacterium]|nr:hypothetical protein [Syntrophorhabdaceae bacterium]